MAEPLPGAGANSAAESSTRVVRVAAESLSRLMGLAGESLVQARQLRPFVDSPWSALKRRRKTPVIDTLRAIEARRGDGTDAAIHGRTACRGPSAEADRCVEKNWAGMLEAFDDFARRGEDLAGRLHHEVLTSRMRPMSEGIRGFPRMVREMAREPGQAGPVRGQGAKPPAWIATSSTSSKPRINHLIRNALDHAIEPPDGAAKIAGKGPDRRGAPGSAP